MSAAAAIARALGHAQRLPDGGWLASCPMPTHGQRHGDRNPSLSLRDGDRGLLVYCHAGCDARDVLAELRRRGLIADGSGERGGRTAQPKPAPKPERAVDKDAQHRKAAWLWAIRRPLIGSPAETYLRSPRNITCALPFATLGYLPPRGPDQHPAMIAAYGRHEEPEPGVLGFVRGAVNSVHLTLLKPDGSGKADVKKPKIIVGSPSERVPGSRRVVGRPIELAPIGDSLGLLVAEGVESALSVHQSTGLGAWAAGAAPFLPALADAVPNWMDCVSIIVDPDDAGRRFSFQLAERLRARGLYVELRELAHGQAARCE